MYVKCKSAHCSVKILQSEHKVYYVRLSVFTRTKLVGNRRDYIKSQYMYVLFAYTQGERDPLGNS
jgi:hypothetical protein